MMGGFVGWNLVGVTRTLAWRRCMAVRGLSGRTLVGDLGSVNLAPGAMPGVLPNRALALA